MNPGLALLVLVLGEVSGRALTLEEAVRTAESNQPALRQARAASALAEAEADAARAPLLPQVTATASYRRTTANRVLRVGTPTVVLDSQPPPNSQLYDWYSFGVTGTQLIYDFQAIDRYRAARASTAASTTSEGATRLGVVFQVRLSFYAARAQRELCAVARRALENQESHLAQVQGFVSARLRPEIDLAQARLDVSNARLQLANAESGYASAKAELTQAMGVEPGADFDVADVPLSSLNVEDASAQSLRERALQGRTEFAALDKKAESQRLAVSAARGSYGPALWVSGSASEVGTDLGRLRWNYYGQVTLSWHLFQGMLTPALVSQARAGLESTLAERDALRRAVEADVEKARVGIRAAKAALEASNDAVENAHERLRLAEGRYQAGIANGLEFGDAQLASIAAEVQKVQTEYSLLSARAALLRALGTR